MRYPQLSTETVAGILAALASGATIRATAAQFGVSPSTVSRYRDNAKLPVRYQRHVVTSAQWVAARRMVTDHGMTQTAAARAMGVSQGHLSRTLARDAA